MKLSLPRRRILAIAFFAFFIFYLVYVIAIWAAVRGGGLSSLTRNAEDVKVAASSGYSLFPGHYTLFDVQLRMKDHNIEVGVDAQKLSLEIALFPLFSKVIQVDSVRGDGVVYKMLHRVHDGKSNRERIAAFPDLGFDRPKVYDSPKPERPLPTWRLRIENIQANIIEAWVLEYRARGKMIAHGGFEIAKDVRVFPSRVTVEHATISVAQRTFAHDVDCKLGATIGPFPKRNTPATQVIEVTDGQIDCDLAIDDLSNLGIYFPDSPLIVEGRGELHTKLAIHRGQVRSSTAHGSFRLNRLGVAGGFLKADAAFNIGIASTGETQLAASLVGNETKKTQLAVDRIKLDLTAEQAKIWQLTASAAHLTVEDVAIHNPSLIRELTQVSKAPLVKTDQIVAQLDYIAASTAQAGALSVDAKGAAVVFPAEDQSISCSFAVKTKCKLTADQASCHETELACSPLSIEGSSAEQTGTIAASLKASKLQLNGTDLSSEWQVQASNPKKLLRAVAASDVWTKLGLAIAPLGEVEAQLVVNRNKYAVSGAVKSFKVGLFSGEGGFILAEQMLSRWRVKTPVGQFGVVQAPSGTKVTPFVNAKWDVTAF